MSDKPISVGDLVMITGDCCTQELVGGIGEVTALHSDGLMCLRCGFISDESGAIVQLRQGKDKQPYSWLKRIPPLEELDDVKRDEEITA